MHLLCCAVLCCAVLCCAVLCCAVLCCAVLCCAVLCCALLRHKCTRVGSGVVHGTSWELEKVRGNGVMAMLTLAIISVVAALQVFGKDRLVFWRESESGMPHLAAG